MYKCNKINPSVISHIFRAVNTSILTIQEFKLGFQVNVTSMKRVCVQMYHIEKIIVD